MKKILAILMFIAVSMPIWGATFTVDNLRYEEITAASGSTYGTVKCIGFNQALTTNTALTIPYIVTYNRNNYYVKSVGQSAFEGDTKITSVRLTYGVQDIENAAFRNCSSMTFVRLPSSIKNIYGFAFGGCTSLNSVYYAALKTGLASFSSTAFPVSNESKLYIPRGANKDDFGEAIWSTFSNRKYQSSHAWDIYMSDGTMAIVTKPSTSTSVDHECTIIGFNKNGGGEDVADGIYAPASSRTKPNGQDRYFKYTKVAGNAFKDNADLIKLDLSNVTSITEFGSLMCDGASNLTRAYLASGKLADRAFNNCPQLLSVNLTGVTGIGSSVFQQCNSIVAVTIPASVSDVMPDFASGCESLKHIYVDKDNPNYEAYNYSLYTKGQKELLAVPQGYDEKKSGTAAVTYSTSEKCEIIHDKAFNQVANIIEVNIKYGCKKVGFAFYDCPKLVLIEIPSSVETFSSSLYAKCPVLDHLFVNLNQNKIPAINKKTFIDNNPYLYIQDGLESSFKSMGWTDFLDYNQYGTESADYYYDHISYTIKLNKPVTVNGRVYDGSAKVVHGRMRNLIKGDTYVLDHITINDKDYVIDEISDRAFAGIGIDYRFSILGCDNVQRVGNWAFYNQRITSIELPHATYIGQEAFAECPYLNEVKLGDDVKDIMHSAFKNSPVANDMFLPVGLYTLGNDVFAGTNIKTLLVPSTVEVVYSDAFRNMSSLSLFICNKKMSSNSSLNMSGVPTSCVIRTPVEYLSEYKANASFKNFSSIDAGAFDFCQGGPSRLSSNIYKMTVTSTTPVTKDGVTYAGTAKYVYNSEMKRGTAFYANLSETNKMNAEYYGKKYLMTEIGDSCMNGSAVESVSLVNANCLEKIGRKVFAGSKVREITVPESVNYFGTEAFSNATRLSELTLLSTGSVNWQGQWVGNNASDFTLYLNSYNVNGYVASNMQNWKFNETDKVIDHVAPFIKPVYDTFHLGQGMPLDFAASGVKAFTVMGYNPNDKITVAKEVRQVPANTGVIVTGLTPGTIYKIKRAASASPVGTNMLVAVPGASIDLYKIDNAYRWDVKNKKFVRPTSTYNSGSGYCYLKTNISGPSEYYLDLFPPVPVKKGDVNGDGEVDVTDINILLNIILGKDSASNYGGRADVDGNGDVDVSDANQMTNIMLGK